MDFLEIRTRDIPELFKKYTKDLSKDEEEKIKRYSLINDNPGEVLEKIENIYEYSDGYSKNGTKKYVALFKELFFGNYVDFFLIMRFDQKHLYLSIKMEKKNITIEMNSDELRMKFEYLIDIIQENLNELI